MWRTCKLQSLHLYTSSSVRVSRGVQSVDNFLWSLWDCKSGFCKRLLEQRLTSNTKSMYPTVYCLIPMCYFKYTSSDGMVLNTLASSQAVKNLERGRGYYEHNRYS